MSKALVIKNADFSANKVTTITFDEEVPCTAVAFDSATVTLDSLGVATVGYTLTPSNTTDTVTITSSDSAVVSVNGTTITAVGNGTCTLTLTCGSYSATCSVTVSVTVTVKLLIGIATTVASSISGEQYDGLWLDGSSTTRILCAGAFSDGFFTEQIEYSNPVFDAGEITAINIPDGTTAIHIEASDVYNGSNVIYFVDADSSFTYNSHSLIPILDKVILSPTGSSTVNIDEDVAVPSGATGYVLVIRDRNSATISSITTESALTTYVEETKQLAISYLTT